MRLGILGLLAVKLAFVVLLITWAVLNPVTAITLLYRVMCAGFEVISALTHYLSEVLV